ncbi:phosphatidylglycerophosphate phosphatase PTPMT1 [Helianthus annuus]|uniref:phosphatidylglycerophosphate phosphatase PTPMT1 n=1 Tax=Helianthus annuus TaxID=4232 RepID=UPI000B8FF11F|nr:phosphatidylglycerophosphate phosphatase PTPMT1 [Helianthus annuus]
MTACRSMDDCAQLLWTQRVMFTSNYLARLVGLFKILKVGTFLLPSKLISFFLLGVVPFSKDVYRLKQLNVGGVVTLKEPYETLVPTSFYQAHDIDHPVIPTRDIAHPRMQPVVEPHTCTAKVGKKGVEYRYMTSIAALEYVRSRRPRVLLAPSQWKVKPPYVP